FAKNQKPHRKERAIGRRQSLAGIHQGQVRASSIRPKAQALLPFGIQAKALATQTGMILEDGESWSVLQKQVPCCPGTIPQTQPRSLCQSSNKASLPQQ